MIFETPHVLFAGGGTAGHLTPGLAVAQVLARHFPEIRITFAGTGKPLEREHVAAAGFAYLALPCRPFPRRMSDALRFIVDNVAGYRTATRYLRDEHVSLAVGLGGYASVPTVRAAARRGIPYLLLEQNVVPGRATRWLASDAKVVCTAFEQTRELLREDCLVRCTGVPVRAELARRAKRASERAARRLHKPFRLLVLGGSGGSRTLNQQVPRAVYKAGAILHGWKILHQTGPRDVEETRELYAKLGMAPRVVPFIQDVGRRMCESDLVVSRAGGTTLAELALIGLPSILLPYPHATDDHQRKNADAFVDAGAARLLDERELTGRLDDHLATHLADLASNVICRQQMSANMRRLAQPRAAERVARLVAGLLPRAPRIATV